MLVVDIDCRFISKTNEDINIPAVTMYLTGLNKYIDLWCSILGKIPKILR